MGARDGARARWMMSGEVTDLANMRGRERERGVWLQLQNLFRSGDVVGRKVENITFLCEKASVCAAACYVQSHPKPFVLWDV